MGRDYFSDGSLKEVPLEWLATAVRLRECRSRGRLCARSKF
jgi:hypothetical protein